MDFFNIEKDDNYILNLPGQFSANPLICFTPYNNVIEDVSTKENVNIPDTNLSKIFNKVKDRFIWSSAGDRGLFDLLDNWNNIRRSKPHATLSLFYPSYAAYLREDIDKKIHDLNLKGITVYGNVNPEELHYHMLRSEFWCYLTDYEETYCISIVRSLDLNASISKEFASMISIGAQSNGNKLNENSTAFSKYNFGLIDRTFREKNTTKEKKKTALKRKIQKKKKHYQPCGMKK